MKRCSEESNVASKRQLIEVEQFALRCRTCWMIPSQLGLACEHFWPVTYQLHEMRSCNSLNLFFGSHLKSPQIWHCFVHRCP